VFTSLTVRQIQRFASAAPWARPMTPTQFGSESAMAAWRSPPCWILVKRGLSEVAPGPGRGASLLVASVRMVVQAAGWVGFVLRVLFPPGQRAR